MLSCLPLPDKPAIYLASPLNHPEPAIVQAHIDAVSPYAADLLTAKVWQHLDRILEEPDPANNRRPRKKLPPKPNFHYAIGRTNFEPSPPAAGAISL